VLREFIPLILLISPVLGLFLIAISLVVWIGAIYDAYHGAEEFKAPATLRLATLSRSRVCAKAGARGTVGGAGWSPSFIQRKPRVGQNDGQPARRCAAH
jgi:hypothetical protein